eukprot:s720_g31.t1
MVKRSLASSIDDLVTSAEAKTILDRCQDSPALAIKVLKYLEQGLFDAPKAATCRHLSKCVCVDASSASVANKDNLSVYDDKLVTTARADRAPDQFVKYCLAKLRSEFDINNSASFPKSTADRRLMWMFALDLSASTILPGESAKEQPEKKKAKADRRTVKRQYSSLATWAAERYACCWFLGRFASKQAAHAELRLSVEVQGRLLEMMDNNIILQTDPVGPSVTTLALAAAPEEEVKVARWKNLPDRLVRVILGQILEGREETLQRLPPSEKLKVLLYGVDASEKEQLPYMETGEGRDLAALVLLAGDDLEYIASLAKHPRKAHAERSEEPAEKISLKAICTKDNKKHRHCNLQMADSLAQIQMQQQEGRDFGLVHRNRQKRPAIEDLRQGPEDNEALLYCDMADGELKLKPDLLGLDTLAKAFKQQTGVLADKKKTKRAASDDLTSSAA